MSPVGNFVRLTTVWVAALGLGLACGKVVPREADDDGEAGGGGDGDGDGGVLDDDDNGLGGGDEFGDDDDGGDGGGDGDGDAPIPRCMEQSGTRLKRVVLDHGGEDADFLRFVDTAYGSGVTCTFQKAYDGSFRCLPSQGSDAVFTGGIRLWTNASCTAQIVEVAYEGTPTSFVVFDFPSYDVCGGSATLRYHQAGSRLPYDGDETVYEKDQNGACVARLSYFNRSYYNLGAEIPPSSFVGAEEKYSSYGRLGVHYAEADDGSRWCDHGTTRDTTRSDESCSPSLAEDGELRCLPSSNPQSTLYASSNCTTGATIAAAVGTTCGPVSNYVREPFGTCDYRQILRQRGGSMGGPYYFPSGGTCYALGDATVYSEGAPIPASDFELFVEEHTVVGDRLERVDHVADGARMFRGNWWDPELESACRFRRTENGVWRCVPVTTPEVPVATSYVSSYGDAACTQLVKAVPVDCASGNAPRYYVSSSEQYRAYTVSPTGQQLYSKATGPCAVINPSITYHVIGAAVPVADLVSAFESTL
ncbi:MAG TPA: hypothetical protein VMZ28_13560 [Kofleriaceae bacterium]|nr:hypothetical protein [Kofleriaceae bacterium]